MESISTEEKYIITSNTKKLASVITQHLKLLTFVRDGLHMVKTGTKTHHRWVYSLKI